MRADSYATLDIMVWAEKTHGPAFVEFLKKNYHPFDVLFALAEKFSISPPQRKRLCRAGLVNKGVAGQSADEEYSKIGEQLEACGTGGSCCVEGPGVRLEGGTKPRFGIRR